MHQINYAPRNCTKMYRGRILAEFFCKLCTETVFSLNFHGKNALHTKLSNGYAIPHALCSSGNIFADSFKFPPLLDKNRESSPRGVLTPKTFNEITRSLTRPYRSWTELRRRFPTPKTALLNTASRCSDKNARIPPT